MSTRLEFTVTGMHCASCGLLIDDVVEELAGVARCQTDARVGRTVVELAPGATVGEAEITAAITASGYTARRAR